MMTITTIRSTEYYAIIELLTSILFELNQAPKEADQQSRKRTVEQTSTSNTTST